MSSLAFRGVFRHTFLAWALQPLFKICARPLQTLILSALMVLLIAYGIVPLVNRLGSQLRTRAASPMTQVFKGRPALQDSESTPKP